MALETRLEKIARIEASLTKVRASIEESQESISLGVFGRSVTRPGLETLYKREKFLESQLEKLYDSNGVGGVKFARFNN